MAAASWGVCARVDAPAARAIPWLLLDARSDGAAGTFARVSRVQRINTTGGLPPSGGCGAETLGQKVRIAYRADYALHVPRP